MTDGSLVQVTGIAQTADGLGDLTTSGIDATLATGDLEGQFLNFAPELDFEFNSYFPDMTWGDPVEAGNDVA